METKPIISAFKCQGIRYIVFRSLHELRRRSGMMRLGYQTSYAEKNYISLEDFRKEDNFFFTSRASLSIPKCPSNHLKEKAEKIFSGELPFFSNLWYKTGPDNDWLTNPCTGYKYDIHKHWTQVEDMDPVAGDIKFVWEKSRFSWLVTIMRYDYHFDEDNSEFVFNQILDWIDKNPLNCGPNYKCSQEISIRILNWFMLLTFYKNSKALTEERFQTIINSIYWQIKHVESNIHFSRICVRNNHAITETLTLYLSSLLMPWLPGSAKRKRKGRYWFEKEVEYQIEDDGTFIQDSMNYHRVAIQLLSWAISLSDKHGEKLSDFVYEKAYKSVNFLYQCQDPANGWLPNYGANDGALFFPLSDSDYRDYRPQLDALHGLLTGSPLYGEYNEDALWMNVGVPSYRDAYSKIEKQYGLVEFKNSGFYLFREKETLTFIRCGLFKSNGSRDQLHLDIWYKGANVLMDGGSYKYNTDEDKVRYFAGTESHNTIMIGDFDQMQKGARFMWFYPPSLLSATVKAGPDGFEFVGKINAFKHLVAGGVTICREIKKKKDCAEWIVTDTVEGAPANILKRQLWHTDKDIQIVSDGTITVNEGFVSEYYGAKRSIKQIEVQSLSNRIVTIITVKG